MKGTAAPSQFEMGLSSIASILTSISMQTADGNSLLKQISNDVTTLIKDVKTPFQPISTRMLKYNKLLLENAIKTREFLANLITNPLSVESSTDTNNIDSSVLTTISNNIEAILNHLLNSESSKPNQIKDSSLFSIFSNFPAFEKFMKTDIKKLKNLNAELLSLGKNFDLLGKFSVYAGTGMLIFGAALFLLSAVPLMGIVKFIIVLSLLGVGIGLFVGRIAKALSGTGFIKTYMILNSLGGIFEGIGKGILMLSLALAVFNFVGYGAIIKLAISLMLVSLSFKMLQNDKGEFPGTFMLLALGVAVFTIATQLVKLQDVDWTSVFKLSALIFSVGMALKFGGFTGKQAGAFKNPLTMFGISLGLLTLSLLSFENINWDSILKIGILITTVATGLLFLNKTGSNNSAILGFSIGMAIMAYAFGDLQELDIMTIIQVIGVIGLLGVTLNFLMKKYRVGDSVGSAMGIGNSGAGGNMLFGFAFGLLAMSIAMYLIAQVPFAGIWKTIVFIAALNLVLIATNKLGGIGGSKLPPLSSFAFGLAVMTLAMFAMAELPWDAMAKTLIFIGALMLILAVSSKISGTAKLPPLTSFAFGLGIMVIAMFAMNELPWEALNKTLLFVGTLMTIMTLASKFGGTGMGAMFLMISIGLVVMGYGIEKIAKATMEIKNIAMFALTMTTIIGIVLFLGIPAITPIITTGIIAFIGMGIGLLIGANAMKKISDIKLDPLAFGTFILGMGILTIGFITAAPYLVAGAIGAGLFIVVALAALLGAEALSGISKYKYNAENIDIFSKGVEKLAEVFSTNILEFIKGAVGAVGFILIASSALLGAITLSFISRLTIKDDKIEIYGKSVKLLVSTINEFGIIELGKGAIKVAALIPIFAASYLGAIALKKIAEVNISKEKIVLFGDMMSLMIDTVLVSLANNEDKMERAKPGLEALVKLMNVSKGLAETIQMMANLKFYEYGVENGKLVLKGVRQLTTNDFKMVGVNLGTMLETLIAPLAILGSDSNMITIGGKTFANPFKNNNTLAGIEVMAKMGAAYKPMAESIKTLAVSGVMTDPVLTKRFTDSLISITSVYLWIFQKLAKIDDSLIYSSIGTITRFNNGFKNLPIDQITSVDTIFNRFINNLSDDLKWKKLRSNIKFMRMEFEAMTKSINSLNIEKATIFEKTVRNLIEKNNGQGLKEAAESLKSLLDLVETNKAENKSDQQTNSFANPFTNPFTNPTQTQNNTKTKTQDTKQSISDELAQQLSSALSQIQSVLSAIDSKLGGTLKIKNIANSGNMI